MKQSHQVDRAEDSEYEQEENGEDESDEADVWILRKNPRTKYMVKPKFKMSYQTEWSDVTVQIDNGSEVNCLTKQDLMVIDPEAQLKATKTKLKAYGDTTIYPLGELEVMIKINDRRKQAEFVVVEDAAASLLSGQLSEDLGLISSIKNC